MNYQKKLDDDLLTPSEVARLFQVSAATVGRWAKLGALSFTTTLGGRRRYNRTEVYKLLNSPPEKCSPQRIIGKATGLWESCILAASLKVGLFDYLGKNRGTVSTVSKNLGIERRPAEIILAACTSMRLVRHSEGLYYLTEESRIFLTSDSPNYIGSYIEMLHEHVNPRWLDLISAIKNNSPVGDGDGKFGPDQKPSKFWEGLAALSRLTAAQLAQVIDMNDTHLLDVGGGLGEFSMELCRRFETMTSTVFDLPHVSTKAKEHIYNSKLEHRVDVSSGDFFSDALPAAGDTILLSMILHDWAKVDNLKILKNCWEALPSGGRLVICDMFLDKDKSGPLDAALMGVNMLVNNWGQSYTLNDYFDWLTEVGFTGIESFPIESPGANFAITAWRE